MERGAEEGAVGDREGDVLRTEEDAERMKKGEEDEVGHGGGDEDVRGGGDLLVLAAAEQDGAGVEPQE